MRIPWSTLCGNADSHGRCGWGWWCCLWHWRWCDEGTELFTIERERDIFRLIKIPILTLHKIPWGQTFTASQQPSLLVCGWLGVQAHLLPTTACLPACLGALCWKGVALFLQATEQMANKTGRNTVCLQHKQRWCTCHRWVPTVGPHKFDVVTAGVVVVNNRSQHWI